MAAHSYWKSTSKASCEQHISTGEVSSCCSSRTSCAVGSTEKKMPQVWIAAHACVTILFAFVCSKFWTVACKRVQFVVENADRHSESCWCWYANRPAQAWWDSKKSVPVVLSCICCSHICRQFWMRKWIKQLWKLTQAKETYSPEDESVWNFHVLWCIKYISRLQPTTIWMSVSSWSHTSLEGT